MLDAVWAHQPVHRAELARITGLSKPTVSLSLDSLRSAGLVHEVVKDLSRPSRAAGYFSAVADAGYVLSVDIGAHFVRGRLCDLSGSTASQVDIALKNTTLNSIVRTTGRAVSHLVDKAGVRRADIVTSVVGVPGIISADSASVIEAGALRAIEGDGFAARLSNELGLRITLDNDVNLMALGEQAMGLGQGIENFATVSIGSGMGAGLVLSGQLYRGTHGGAGEIHLTPFREVAHTGVQVDPASEGLEEVAARASRRRRGSSLSAPFDPVQVFAAARNGDLAALDVLESEARALSLYLGAISAVLDVELIVLAGGIGSNAQLMLEGIRSNLAERLPYPPRVEISALGRGAVLAGAASVGLAKARDSLFVNRDVTDRA